MALRVFANNVMILAVENCLIADIPNIISPEQAYNMSNAMINTLTTDSDRTGKAPGENQTTPEQPHHEHSWFPHVG